MQRNFWIVVFLLLPVVSWAENYGEVVIVIKNHQFQPDRVHVPAGKKVKLLIDNQDSTPEEFESYALNREKIIQGGKKGIVYIGSLKAGSYDFMGEFNQATAKGTIVAE